MDIPLGALRQRHGRHRAATGLGYRFNALWTGQTASLLGDYIAYLTLPLFVFELAQSNLDFALTYSLENVPTLLLGFAGGVVLDRLNLRVVMIAADLARALAFFVLARLAGSEDPGLVGVFLLAFVIGSFSALFQNALNAFLPALVPASELITANARLAATQQATLVAGPAIAGVMSAAFGSAGPGFILNGVTFLVSAASLAVIGPVGSLAPERPNGGFIEDALHGVRYLWGELRLRSSTIAAATANFVVGFIESTFVIFAKDLLGTTSDRQIGLTYTALGLGGLAGAALVGRVTRVLGLGRTMTAGMAIFGLGLWVAANSRYGAGALLVLFVWFAGLSLVNVPLATIRQYYTPSSMLGRVISASRAIGWSTLPLGALLGASISDTGVGYRPVALAAPLVLMVAAAGLVFTPIWSDSFGPRGGRRVAE
jgi:MFS family permease